DLGVVPTPAVARWCADHQVAGVMISASHNPWYDNGIKFFAPGGSKLGDRVQDEIQARFDALLGAEIEASPTIVDAHDTAAESHVERVVASLEGRSLTGLVVVADAANGAAYDVAHRALTRLGADVTMLHAAPNGTNINDGCGSTHPASLQAAVVERGADLGVAFDGDADRLLAVDADGRLIDGDQIIALCALDAKARGRLAGDAVVVTVMTNLGFRRAMHDAGIHIVDTVQLLDIVARRGRPLGALADAAMTRLPQVLQNVRVAQRPVDVDGPLAPFIDASLARMAGRGRVLIRPSGTEPLIRVMVEAETDAEARMEADGLVAAVESLFG
ncbi:MAG: phosphoglucosamine mutase, partial [Actinobacteria bacterium]|nr:phosphoglucosamine mutase [Actinomycetota bacterium]